MCKDSKYSPIIETPIEKYPVYRLPSVLRFFQGLGDHNDHRVLSFLEAPGFLYKKIGKACKAEM